MGFGSAAAQARVNHAVNVSRGSFRRAIGGPPGLRLGTAVAIGVTARARGKWPGAGFRNTILPGRSAPIENRPDAPSIQTRLWDGDRGRHRIVFGDLLPKKGGSAPSD